MTSGSPAAASERRQPVVPADDLVRHRAGLDLARPADHARARGTRPPSWCSSRCGTASSRRPAMSSCAGRCRSCRGRSCCRRSPASSSALSSLPTCPSCSTMPSAYSVRAVSPGGLRRSAATWVRRCIRVLLYQQKNGLPAVGLPLDVVDGRVRRLVVDRLHPLLGQRPGVLDRLLADAAESRVDGRVVLVGGLALQHAAGAEHRLELAGRAGRSAARAPPRR